MTSSTAIMRPGGYSGGATSSRDPGTGPPTTSVNSLLSGSSLAKVGFRPVPIAMGDQEELCGEEDVDSLRGWEMNANESTWAASTLATFPTTPAVSSTCLPYYGVGKCRMNCGREVQPGLTRTMKRFDTCCKKCVATNGKGGHDENCGKVRDASGGEVSMKAWHEWRSRIEALNTNDEELRRLVSQVLGANGASNSQASMFPTAIFGKDSSLSYAQVEKLVHDFIGRFAPLEAKRGAKDPMVAELISVFDEKGKGKIKQENFYELCRMLFRKLHEEWFPTKLPLSTRAFVQRNPRSVQEVYKVTARLGHGSYGVVHAAEHRISGTHRVCKLIKKSAMEGDTSIILQEIHNMAMLDHPNVVKVYEYFDDENYVSQIIEQCKGGELKARIEAYHKRGQEYGEAFMKDVMKQTMRALAFMHSARFAHKDLKPENIMMVEKDSASSSIKIIDFGLAEHFNPHSDRSAMVGGTLLFMPPEVFLTGQMTMKCDIWSAGVVLYNLITGTYPYQGTWPPPPGKDESHWEEETAEQIISGPMAIHEKLRSVSAQCRQFLVAMLQKEEPRRPNATMCLDHDWFQRDKAVDEPTLSVGVVQCIEAYARMSELKKAIFLLMAHQSAVPAVGELRQIFTHFDVGNRGALTTQDLRLVLARAGTPCLSAERVVHALDRESTGTIGWTEFLSAVLCISICHDTKLVDSAFATFDTNQDGRIYVDDLLKVLGSSTGGNSRWKDRLPELFLEMVPKEFRRPGKKLWVNKEQFRAYVGQHIQLRMPGDKIYAVG